VDWRRISLTEHMTEAAALVAECHVAFDFTPAERAVYEIKVYESLKGGAGARYFAIGTDRDEPGGFRPLGSGETPEDALQACLGTAGIYHRRRVKQAE
jgi:hypothetical protein